MTMPNGPGASRRPRGELVPVETVPVREMTETATEAQQLAHDRRMARVDAAREAGWVFRYDPIRDEYTASRVAVTMRTLDGLLDAIEAQR